MAFPATPLPIKAELLINGTWTDVTSKVRLNDRIAITRGFSSEQGNTLQADQCSFSLNNRDGLFSNRNPNSIYFGLLGINTQFRAAVTDTAGNYLELLNGYYPFDGYAQTADKAVLDVVGDIDIRGDIDPVSWTPATQITLASKYTGTGNQRSWIVCLNTDGTLSLIWSATGGSTLLTATSTAPVATSGRKAWRVTLDVNNGAGGWTATFYTAASGVGTGTQLGSAVTVAGTTSIFSSTTALAIGNGPDGAQINNGQAYQGKFYRFQLYNNIAGTLVADANFGSRTVGDTSWSDGLGTPNTWALSTEYAAIVGGTKRFWGEIPEFPQKWDTTGTDVWVPIQASSIVRRISQGAQPLASSMLRFLSAKTSLIGYWPMEDEGSEATFASSYLTTQVAAPAVNLSFGSDSLLHSATSVATLSDSTSRITGQVRTKQSATFATFTMMFRYGTLPGGTPELVYIYGNGTVRFWTVLVDATNIYVAGFNAQGVALGSAIVVALTGGVNVQDWIALRIQITTSAGNISLQIDWNRIGDGTNHQSTTAAYTAGSTVGYFTGYDINPFANADNSGLHVSHVAILQEDLRTDNAGFVAATEAYLGETAGTRFLRLCGISGITGRVIGTPANTEPMGVQGASSTVTLLQECADVEGGFLYAARDFFGLTLRSRASMILRSAMTLDYSLFVFDGQLQPTDDDKVMRNDVTVSRPFGGSGRSVITSGPNNINDPTTDPQGVGRYDTAYSLNVLSDFQATRMAEYGTFLGSWSELRIPNFTVSLERAPFLASAALSGQVARLDMGDPVKITNLPAWLPPGSIEVMYRGCNEVLENRGWSFTVTTQSYGPFRSLNDTTTGGVGHYRAAAANTTVQSGFTSTATSFTVTVASGSSKWSSTAVPFDIVIAGERMTVGAIAAPVGTNQTFSSVTRSVNGIVKAHLTGEAVQIFDTFYAAL